MSGYGPKLADGLRVFAALDLLRRSYIASVGYTVPMADAMLEQAGYPPKVAEDILDRMERKGWLEYGVSQRTGRLTDKGWEAARRIGL